MFYRLTTTVGLMQLGREFFVCFWHLLTYLIIV